VEHSAVWHEIVYFNCCIVLQPAEDSDVRPQFLRMSAVVIISIIRLASDTNSVTELNWTEIC